MVWPGNGSDTKLYGSCFNGGGWQTAEALGGATVQPSVTFNAQNQAIRVSVRGENGVVWLNNQDYGSPDWNGWFQVGGGPPHSTSRCQFRRN
jgi:hypothetical protein